MHPLTQNLAFIDLETTGVDTSKDRAIEACILVTTPDFREVARTTLRINPEMAIPAEATEVHGITNEELLGEPTFAQVAGRIQAAIDNCILVGHNVSFDVQILHRQLVESGCTGIPVTTPLVDTQRIERFVNSHRLVDTYKRYTGQEHTEAHGAEADVLACMTVLQAQLRTHADRVPSLAEATVAGIDKLDGKEPKEFLDHAHKFERRNGVILFAFGPHEGQPIETQKGFLTWMLNKDFAADTKAIARSVLPVGRTP